MLDERKKRILQAIIKDYISFAEPVGSRTIARKYDLGVGSATIRNEMADLELLGYLEHLHTSSGRIPSSKGYRFYVDGLMPQQELSDKEKALIDTWYDSRVKRVDEVFQETARLLSHLTKNVSLVLAPHVAQSVFRYLKFLPLDESHIVAVIMTDAGFVENKILDIPAGVSYNDFYSMADLVNKCLAGQTLATIKRDDLSRIRQEAINSSIYTAAMEVIERSLTADKQERLYTGGARQLMDQPEFSDMSRVKEILSMLEEEQLVKDILHSQSGEGLRVTIGRENKYSGIQDCSIITATYHLDGKFLGTIAVLGPTRMQYGHAMMLLDYINNNLTEIIRKLR